MKDMPASASLLENRLLNSLPSNEWERLRLGMVPVRLISDQVLIEPNRCAEHVFFLENGFACILAFSGERSAQVAIIGNEGMVGGMGLLGGDALPACAIMRAPGQALRIPLPLLRLRLDQCPSLRDAWLRHLHRLTCEIMQTATDNACSTLDQRCARWLLLAVARLDGDEVPVTHETLAGMLGVFRSGVTAALSSLHERGLIQASRGRITVLNRAGLHDFSVPSVRQAAAQRSAKSDRSDLGAQG